MDIKKKIIIKGQRVHDVGYRPYLLGIAESLEIERFFAKNILIDEKQVVHALVDSSEEKVKAFIDIVSTEFPEKSEVENVELEDLIGNVMKIESYYRYLTATQLSKIATYGGKMLDMQEKTLNKQEKTLNMQEKTLEKQDLHIEITKNGFNDMLNKQDESLKTLNNINNDTSEIKSTLKTTELQRCKIQSNTFDRNKI
ncbi:MAG: acylphosphatase [Candidatus Methanoperedens sp.]|nr:acylphosphatase [Candidatus Methanoperedens sp.]